MAADAGRPLAQAYQVWVLGWPRPRVRGALGEVFPWLHYGYALVMLIALFLLRPGPPAGRGPEGPDILAELLRPLLADTAIAISG